MNIAALYDAAELSFAAYATLDKGAPKISALTDPDIGMTQTQAERFAAKWSVVDQHTDSASGFSATVFEKDGQRYLAIRGTEPSDVLDLIADADLAVGGAAAKQIVALYNYVMRLTGSIGQPVSQLEWNGQSYSLSSSTSVVGILDTPVSGTVTVSGHSLGGHLAMAFGRLFPQLTAQIDTYNAPGFWDGISSDFFARIDIALGRSGSTFLGGVTTNVYGSGLNIIAGLANHHGVPQEIFLEHNTHSIVALTDSLALYKTFSNLSSAISESAIPSILKTASSTDSRSLEAALDALRILLIDDSIATNTSLQTKTDDREDFYNNLYELQDSAGYSTLKGSAALRSLAEQDAGTLATQASNDFGVFLALNYLLPISIEGSGSTLIGVHANLYAAWQADTILTTAQKAGGAANYSDNWLTDRAEMLHWLLKANEKDQIYIDSGLNLDGAWLYEDYATGKSVVVQPNGGIGGIQHKVLFGSDNTSYLPGTDNADHLYGMGGADDLRGGGGSDYLEGGTDADAMDGGEDNDTIFGGAGDDTLTGGKAGDILKGGAGSDTYVFVSGDGWDWVEDSDGLGTIKYDNLALTGGRFVADNVWLSDDNRFTFSLYDQVDNGRAIKVLAIQGPDGGMWVKDWQSGNLGITLQDAPAAPQPSAVLTGTDGPDNGQLLLSAHEASLIATAADQLVLGLGGADFIWARYAGVDAQGGPGNDVLVDAAGNQALRGEDDNDILIATGGNDTLDGGMGNDALQGGDDDDLLDGGDGMDFLDGGVGADVIVGGNGDDFILGGGNLTPMIYRGIIPSPPNPADFDQLAAGAGQFFLSRDANGLMVVPNVAGVVSATPTVGLPTDAENRGTGYPMVAGDGADLIDGGAGADIVRGGTGDDRLQGSTGDDWIIGEADDDLIWGDGLQGDMSETQDFFWAYTLPEFCGHDLLDGGAGNDTVRGDGGDDTIRGGTGADTLIGDASLDQLPTAYHGRDTLYGEDGADLLFGNGADDLLDGGRDADELTGGAGADSLAGGDGSDKLWGDGADVPTAEQGADMLDGGDGDDYLEGNGGNDTLLGGKGIDQLIGDAGNDLLDGGDGDDTLEGGDGDDSLAGGAGNDGLVGGAGVDRLDGGDGNDILQGGEGGDSLQGGAGADLLQGGAGDDTYAFAAGDGAQAPDGTTDGIGDSGGTDTVRIEGTVSDVWQTPDDLLAIQYGAGDLLAIQGDDSIAARLKTRKNIPSRINPNKLGAGGTANDARWRRAA